MSTRTQTVFDLISEALHRGQGLGTKPSGDAAPINDGTGLTLPPTVAHGWLSTGASPEAPFPDPVDDDLAPPHDLDWCSRCCGTGEVFAGYDPETGRAWEDECLVCRGTGIHPDYQGAA